MTHHGLHVKEAHLRVVRRRAAEHHDDQGFTLIEILIATFIMVAILAPLMASVVFGYKTTTNTAALVRASSGRQVATLYLPRDVAGAASVVANPPWTSTCFGSAHPNAFTGTTTAGSTSVPITSGTVGSNFLNSLVTDTNGAIPGSTTLTALSGGGINMTLSKAATKSVANDPLVLASNSAPLMITWSNVIYSGVPPTTSSAASQASEIDYVLRRGLATSATELPTRELLRYQYSGSQATANCTLVSATPLALGLQDSTNAATTSTSGKTTTLALFDASGYKVTVTGAKRL